MRLLPPEHEDNALGVAGDSADHLLREVFPSLLLVGIRRTFAHREDGVEQEYALLSPFCQITVRGLRAREVHVRVVVERPVDLLERWRAFRGSWHRERHAHRFILFDVRVLAHDHYFQI